MPRPYELMPIANCTPIRWSSSRSLLSRRCGSHTQGAGVAISRPLRCRGGATNRSEGATDGSASAGVTACQAAYSRSGARPDCSATECPLAGAVGVAGGQAEDS